MPGGANPRVALVTGAAGGIGRAEAIALARSGADVAVLGHRDIAGAEETASQCRAFGGRALVVRADIRCSAEVRTAVDQVVLTFGRVDILVNNAGILAAGLAAPLTDMTEESWHLVLDSHLTGTFLCIKHVGPVMIAQRWGRIVNTASIHGRVGGRATLGHYGVAKAGIIALTQTAAREFGPYGVTCNAVSPGFVRTPRIEALMPRVRLDALAGQVPVGRLATPEEIAAAVVFLVSEEAGYVNGAVLDIHGGRMEYV